MKKTLKFFKKKGSWISILVLLFVIIIATIIASLKPFPVRLIIDYPINMLAENTQTMHECAACHDTEEFHSCDTCHKEHGSADMANLNFYSVLYVTGDVPEEKYLPIYQMFSKRYHAENKINVIDFLADMGVDDFESVTFCTNDRGFSTITRENLGKTSYLLPYEEGMRFADEALHISTWLKGVNKIIVVTGEENLTVNGIGYSFGELLLSDTVQFTVEEAPVMLSNEALGTMKTGSTATRLEGVELSKLAEVQSTSNITIMLEDGSAQTIYGEDALEVKLAMISDGIVLVFPDKGRAQWIENVIGLEID